ncbi:MAG: 3-phosphoshikimate 1-carboxyvinyltransferase [Proteobacteria bacterium]|nr:3-phosphoshikimate 1-carboxyvinyltransferase [Pseudomonadota bacterium]
MTALISRPAGPLAGAAAVPGDKSISHRALILGALAVGETRIAGLLASDDVLATAAAVRALGAQAEQDDNGDWRVYGRGVGGLAEPQGVLDMGNSGTAARLLMGVVATHPFTATLAGDKSLSVRPMERVMTPLSLMGAQFTTRSGGCLPITVTGAPSPVPITYELPVASAQIKSAVLLAGLNTPGRTTVIEPQPTRDHTERMLGHFGAEVVIVEKPGAPGGGGAKEITLTGQPELTGTEVTVPGDISSAAFPLVAALLVPDSKVTLTGVGVNPLRSGLIETLREMGAAISIDNPRNEGGEPVADLTVVTSGLKGVTVSGARAPTMIDEYPILAVAAAYAQGVTRLEGLGELRVKESDRLDAIVRGLTAAGVEAEASDDALTVKGKGGPPPGGARIEARLDHRIAMAFLVLGMVTETPVEIDDATTIDTSFPGFADLMNGLGAAVTAQKEG